MNEKFWERMAQYLDKEEFNKFRDSYNEKPSRGVRLNKISKEYAEDMLKTSLLPISYDMDGFYILNDEKYGHNPLHHAGGLYFQEPSAMAPVNSYNFKGNEKVLDLCASPGGKSSQILRRIPNGFLVSNEISAKRAKILFSNLERLGFKNAIVTNNDVYQLSKVFEGFFDVILVDSPCSGEGMMRKDSVAEEMWSLENIELCSSRDKEILHEALKMLKTEGKLIYSTCTFAKEENEDIVEHLCKNEGLEVIEPNQELLPYTKEGFIKNTLRFYPHIAMGEGQFMAVLKKRTESTLSVRYLGKEKKDKELDIVAKFLNDNLNEVSLNISKRGNRYYHLASDINLEGLTVLNYGIELGEIINSRFVPFHHLFKALGAYFKNIVKLDINDPRVLKYLHGEEIHAETPNGFGVIMIEDLVLGGFKASNGALKNYYPKGLRIPSI